MNLFLWLVTYWQRFLSLFRPGSHRTSALPYPSSSQPDRPRRIRKPPVTQAPATDEGFPKRTDPFLVMLYDLIDTNLTNSRFGVGELAEQVGLSRIHLYRKIKSLTGLTATEFLRHYRLKCAIDYLRAGHSVAETSHLVGFESPAYFTKCFREHYQMPPTVFLASQS